MSAPYSDQAALNPYPTPVPFPPQQGPDWQRPACGPRRPSGRGGGLLLPLPPCGHRGVWLAGRGPVSSCFSARPGQCHIPSTASVPGAPSTITHCELPSNHIKRLIQKRKSESRVMAWAVVGSCWHLRSYGASTQVPPPHQQHAPMKKPSLLNTCKRPDPPLGGATRWRGGCNPLIPRIMRTGQHSEGAGSK